MRNRKEADSLRIIINNSEAEVDQLLVVELIADMLLNEINKINKDSSRRKPKIIKKLKTIDKNIRNNGAMYN